MKRFIAALAALVIAITPTIALAEIDTSKLTSQQIAQIEAQAAQMAAENAGATPQATAAKVSEWVDIGKGLGEGVGAAAKEIGVAVVDFSKTDVGKLTMFMIFFKVMGEDLIQLFVGLLFFMVATPIWIYFYRKVWQPAIVEFKYNEAGKKISKTISRESYRTDDALGAYRILGAVVGLLLIGIGSMIIFG